MPQYRHSWCTHGNFHATREQTEERRKEQFNLGDMFQIRINKSQFQTRLRNS